MNHKDILMRAWKILWSYKTLWIFGILLALTSTTFTDRIWQFSDNTRHLETNGSFPGPDYFGESFQDGWDEFTHDMDMLFSGIIPENIEAYLITFSILFGCFVLLLIVVGLFIRYISETSLISMVDEFEQTENKLNWRDGFKMGWSKKSWRLFLIDLVVNLPVFLVFLLLFGLILSPMLLLTTPNFTAGILGSVLSIGLSVILFFALIIVAAAISILKTFFRRICVIDERGVRDSLKNGFSMVRRNLKDILLMWLITIGINIGYAIVIIPVVLLMLVAAATIAGLTGLASGGITGIFAGEALPFIVGSVVGIPIFFIVLIAPLAFLGGLKETFMSTTWTLTFREIQTLESIRDLEVIEADPLATIQLDKDDLPPLLK